MARSRCLFFIGVTQNLPLFVAGVVFIASYDFTPLIVNNVFTKYLILEKFQTKIVPIIVGNWLSKAISWDFNIKNYWGGKK